MAKIKLKLRLHDLTTEKGYSLKIPIEKDSGILHGEIIEYKGGLASALKGAKTKSKTEDKEVTRTSKKKGVKLMMYDYHTWKPLTGEENKERRERLLLGEEVSINKEDKEYIEKHLMAYLPWKLGGALSSTRKRMGDAFKSPDQGGTRGLKDQMLADMWGIKIESIDDIGAWKQVTRMVQLKGGSNIPTPIYFDVLDYVDLTIEITNDTLEQSHFERAIEIFTSGMRMLPGRRTWAEILEVIE